MARPTWCSPRGEFGPSLGRPTGGFGMQKDAHTVLRQWSHCVEANPATKSDQVKLGRRQRPCRWIHICKASTCKKCEAHQAIPCPGCDSPERAGMSPGHPIASPQPDLSSPAVYMPPKLLPVYPRKQFLDFTCLPPSSSRASSDFSKQKKMHEISI